MNNAYLLSQLTNEERLLVNSEIEKRKKNTVVAYLLWFFLGTVGGHRYYFGKIGSAIAMTLITVLTLGFGVIITGIWAIIDVFLLMVGFVKTKTELRMGFLKNYFHVEVIHLQIMNLL